MLRPLSVTIVILFAVTSAGCFGSGALQDGASRAVVTIRMDGEPVENANVSFSPVGQGRSAYGRTNALGIAQMGTSNIGDGVFPGEYNIGVSKSEPDPEHIVHDVDAYHRKHGKFPETIMIYHIPEKYESPASSGFSTTVTSDGSNDIELNLDSE